MGLVSVLCFLNFSNQARGLFSVDAVEHLNLLELIDGISGSMKHEESFRPKPPGILYKSRVRGNLRGSVEELHTAHNPILVV